MSAIIVRMPEQKRTGLKQLVKARQMSVNKLIDEMATVLLTELDAETRFRIRAARGAGREKRGIKLLSKAAGGVRRRAAGRESAQTN